jgi:CubicO group peptidase (beta-lactamase class C family)
MRMKVWRHDPDVDPGSVGVDAAGLEALAEEFRRVTEAGELYHGAQLAVFRQGRCVLEMGGGLARVRTGAAVEPDTAFVIFSATKGVAALVLLMLHERGALHLDEPLVKYWPEFARLHPQKASVTIRHILSHRGGFPVAPDWLTARHWGDRDAIRRAMEEVPLRWTPGEKNAYHAMNFGHVLNELCLRVDGRDLGRLAREEIFGPLGIGDFWIGLPADPALEERVAWCYNRIEDAPTPQSTGVTGDPVETLAEQQAQEEAYEIDPERPDLIPEERHPFNRTETWRAVLPAGGGIATARALAHFYAPLALGGELDGVRLARKESLDHATTPTNRKGEVDRSIGFKIRWGTGWHLDLYGQGSSLRTFGHAGAGGQVGFADPDRGLAFAFLCNGQRQPRFLVWRYKLQTLALQSCDN